MNDLKEFEDVVFDYLKSEQVLEKEEKTLLPSYEDEEADDRTISVTFMEPVTNRYLALMRENIEEFAAELGVEVHVETEEC
jgi:hypothetical protein